MIGIVAFVALAISAVLGQECSCNGVSQNFAAIASPVSSFSGNLLRSGFRSVPSVRSQIVSAPVFLNDGPALMTRATRCTSGPLVATPAVSQSISPAGSISSSSLSSSGSSGFNSAVGSNQVISVASAVPAYVSTGIPSNQVASCSSSSVSLPSVPSFSFRSGVSSPVVESVSSGLYQSPVSQIVSNVPSVQSVQVESPVFNTVSSPLVSGAVVRGFSSSLYRNGISY